MTKVCAVHGTWAYASGNEQDSSWSRYGSPWWAFMRQQGVQPVGQRPFSWTGNIGGLISFRRGGRFADWAAGGEALRNYFESPVNIECPGDVPMADRRIVAHSHGGQVVLHACAQGLRIHTLITIGLPVRDDMRYIVEQARPRIGWWLSVSDASLWSNRMAWMGAIFDGHIGVRWHWPAGLVDVALTMRDIGHSRLLYDPRVFSRWIDDGLMDTLRQT